MNRLSLSAIFPFAIVIVFQANACGECWVLEWKQCNVADDSCGKKKCKDVGLPFLICDTPRGTFSNLGSYKRKKAAVTITDHLMGKTSAITDYQGYIYCTQAIPCNYQAPCNGQYCKDDGPPGSFGSPTFFDKFPVGAKPCPTEE